MTGTNGRTTVKYSVLSPCVALLLSEQYLYSLSLSLQAILPCSAEVTLLQHG
jgi:hypothetical protein